MYLDKLPPEIQYRPFVLLYRLFNKITGRDTLSFINVLCIVWLPLAMAASLLDGFTFSNNMWFMFGFLIISLLLFIYRISCKHLQLRKANSDNPIIVYKLMNRSDFAMYFCMGLVIMDIVLFSFTPSIKHFIRIVSVYLEYNFFACSRFYIAIDNPSLYSKVKNKLKNLHFARKPKFALAGAGLYSVETRN